MEHQCIGNEITWPHNNAKVMNIFVIYKGRKIRQKKTFNKLDQTYIRLYTKTQSKSEGEVYKIAKRKHVSNKRSSYIWSTV